MSGEEAEDVLFKLGLQLRWQKHLTVHALDLIVTGCQLGLPIPLMAQALPLRKHPPHQPLPDDQLTLQASNTLSAISPVCTALSAPPCLHCSVCIALSA